MRKTISNKYQTILIILVVVYLWPQLSNLFSGQGINDFIITNLAKSLLRAVMYIGAGVMISLRKTRNAMVLCVLSIILDIYNIWVVRFSLNPFSITVGGMRFLLALITMFFAYRAEKNLPFNPMFYPMFAVIFAVGIFGALSMMGADPLGAPISFVSSILPLLPWAGMRLFTVTDEGFYPSAASSTGAGAPTFTPDEELRQFKDLLDAGIISEDEYKAMKQKLGK